VGAASIALSDWAGLFRLVPEAVAAGVSVAAGATIVDAHVDFPVIASKGCCKEAGLYGQSILHDWLDIYFFHSCSDLLLVTYFMITFRPFTM